MDTKALRQKILDLAIRGKLVPQDPNDEPASVLLERIRAERQQMVKDGKLKAKDIKNDTVIFKGDDNLHYEQFADGSVKCIEDEIPFELPDGWAWCRIRNIASVKGGKRLPKGESFSDDVTNHVYIRVTDMKNRTINTFGLKYISEEVFAKIQSYTIGKNDLYVTIAGTIGVVGEVPEILDGMNLTENAVKVCNIIINKTFLCYVMLSELVQQQFQDKTHQVAMPKLALERILGTLIPVCPVKEQQLIVFSIKSALQIADTIEIQKDALFELVSATKSKILDLAIRGKLVPQDPNDESASVLLERIRAEKEELIKQGKIKRDKKESVIFKGDDNSYYQDLPHNWQVSTLREITTPLTLNDGDWILTENMTDTGEVKLLQLGSIGNMSYIDKGFKYLTKETFDKLSCTEIFTGYLIINRIISDKMCCCIVPDIDGTIITTVDTCWIAPSETSYDIKFLMYQLASPSFQSAVLLKATGTTRRRISKNNLIDLHLLLPPLAEQERIVNAVETLFAQIDKISEQIS
ncbi:MAG: restriction endonuclease subunit S [Peptoniphilaceae bacterium]|nr:restriction endonuclease subunit S [Peptoniphilaceae bacterium]